MITEREEDFYRRISLRLATARVGKRMSQAQVGIRLGCSRNKIYYQEVGRLRVSTYDLIRLCEIYGLDAAEVLREVTEEMEKAA